MAVCLVGRMYIVVIFMTLRLLTSPSSGQASIDFLLAMYSPCPPLILRVRWLLIAARSGAGWGTSAGCAHQGGDRRSRSTKLGDGLSFPHAPLPPFTTH